MTPLALALSLFLSGQPAAEAPVAPPPPAPEAAAPVEPAAGEAAAPAPASVEGSAALNGAPTDDYQFVAWCFGLLAGYVELHDQVMPEVRRIETTWRRPGSKLADDLKVYDDQQKQAKADLKRFQSAITAAEKASVKPISQEGAAALRRGRAVWNHGPEVTKSRMAQEWMSWSLPNRCSTQAETLETRSKLFGASLQANTEPPPPPAPAEPAKP